MFSTLQKQKEAENLIEEAGRIIEECDHECDLAKERVQKSVTDSDNFRSRLVKKSLKTFYDLLNKIDGIAHGRSAETTKPPYSSQIDTLIKGAQEIEPVEISGVKQGKASALVASFAAAIVTVAVALVTAVIATGTPLDPQKLTSPDTIEKLLAWIGGGAFDYPGASPLLGGVGIVAAAVAAALIVWSILMAKSSSSNLSAARSCHENANNYKREKEFYTEAMKQLNGSILEYEKILETFDIYMDEYIAVTRRILYTEGNDFQNYKESSKEIVKRASQCAEAIIEILDIAIVTPQGTPSEELEKAIERGSALKKALINDTPLPKTVFEGDSSEKEEPSGSDSVTKDLSAEDRPLAIENRSTL